MMEETSLSLMLTGYTELNSSEMCEINGGKPGVFKAILVIGVIALVMGTVNGCNSSQR